MKHSFLIGILVLALSAPHTSAQTNAPASTSATNIVATATAPAEHKHAIHFQANSDGDSSSVAPIQVGGGSRGDNVVPPSVLVPNQVALTTQAQPSLYWYLPEATNHFCELTISEPKRAKPLLEVKSGDSTPAGIHALRLSKFNVTLEPNVLYQWSVADVGDPANRSADSIARGTIKRIDPSPDLAAKLAAASDADKPAIYAENGIWYDALQSISDQITHDPKNQALRDERADLLKQVGLPGKEMEDTVVKSP